MPMEVLNSREIRWISPFVCECFIIVSLFRKRLEILDCLLVFQSSHVTVAVRVNVLRRFQDYEYTFPWRGHLQFFQEANSTFVKQCLDRSIPVNPEQKKLQYSLSILWMFWNVNFLCKSVYHTELLHLGCEPAWPQSSGDLPGRWDSARCWGRNSKPRQLLCLHPTVVGGVDTPWGVSKEAIQVIPYLCHGAVSAALVDLYLPDADLTAQVQGMYGWGDVYLFWGIITMKRVEQPKDRCSVPFM